MPCIGCFPSVNFNISMRFFFGSFGDYKKTKKYFNTLNFNLYLVYNIITMIMLRICGYNKIRRRTRRRQWTDNKTYCHTLSHLGMVVFSYSVNLKVNQDQLSVNLNCIFITCRPLNVYQVWRRQTVKNILHTEESFTTLCCHLGHENGQMLLIFELDM